MSRHGLYQPKIADEHIHTLYQWPSDWRCL
jgi:hypothetical protein